MAPAGPVNVKILPLPVDRMDIRLVHKTSDRGFYDGARAEAGTFEVLFADQFKGAILHLKRSLQKALSNQNFTLLQQCP